VQKNIQKRPCCNLVLPILFLCTLGISPVLAGAWKFAVVCDSSGDGVVTSTAWVNTNVLRKVARGITNDRVDFVLFGGDMIYGSNSPACTNLAAQYAAWSNAFAPVYSAHIPVYPLRGNRDILGDSNGNIYLSVFGSNVPANGPTNEVGLTYSFAHSNALIIGLDQYKNPHRINQPWLNAQLSSNRFPHVFVFGHEPAVQAQSPDCLAAGCTNRDLFLKSITEAGCKIYFCGHDHFYNRGRVNAKNGLNIMQTIAGACGAPFTDWDGVYGQNYGEQSMASNCYYSARTNGYILVTVSNFNARAEWKGYVSSYGDGTPSSRFLRPEVRPSPIKTGSLQSSVHSSLWQTCDTYAYQLTNPAVRNITDYDGDSRADLAVYSESRGELWVARSSQNYSSRIFDIGGNKAVVAPADFDGDGTADPAVYWKNTGTWEISLSDRGYAVTTNIMGGPGYAPAPADYDGDGIADLAIYGKSTGYWQVILSSNGNSAVGFWGGPGYDPVPSDYDGDGHADIVVYRESVGDWQALLSNGQPVGHYTAGSLVWGGPGYLPAHADYDNDGKTDPAVYDSLTGSLLVLLSGANYAGAVALLNKTGCVPVIADYDNDRKADPMLYLNSTACWQGAFSASNYQMIITYYGGPDWVAVNSGRIDDLTFLAFGDSITYGSGTADDGPATAYPMLLEEKLKQNRTGAFISINGGNPGETTGQGLERFEVWLDTTTPDLVLLMEGTNDEFYGDDYDQTEDNLRTMVQMALERGIAVIIATIPPVISNSYRDRSEQQARIVEFNPRIYKIASDYDIPVAQVFEAITAVPNWQNDLMDQPSANHPNDAGHAVMRDAFYIPVSSGLDNGEY